MDIFYAGLILGYAIGCISTACIISYKFAMDRKNKLIGVTKKPKQDSTHTFYA